MGCIYKQGDLELRPFDGLTSSNRIDYEEWMTDKEVTKFNSHGLFPKTSSELEDFIEDAIESKEQITWKIYFKGEFIGMCSLQSINWINRSGEVAIYIGEKFLWGKGLASKVIVFMLEHGFMRLGLHRIWSGTAESNIGMNKVFLKIGFNQEGHFVDGTFLNGQFENINNYSLLDWEYNKRSKSEEGL